MSRRLVTASSRNWLGHSVTASSGSSQLRAAAELPRRPGRTGRRALKLILGLRRLTRRAVNISVKIPECGLCTRSLNARVRLGSSSHPVSTAAQCGRQYPTGRIARQLRSYWQLASSFTTTAITVRAVPTEENRLAFAAVIPPNGPLSELCSWSGSVPNNQADWPSEKKQRDPRKTIRGTKREVLLSEKVVVDSTAQISKITQKFKSI